MSSIRMVNPNKRIENEDTKRFAKYSIEELIHAFNTDQPKKGWVGARGRFLGALRQAFLDTEIDCSNFISEGGMSLQYPIKIEDNIIIQIKDS